MSRQPVITNIRDPRTPNLAEQVEIGYAHGRPQEPCGDVYCSRCALYWDRMQREGHWSTATGWSQDTKDIGWLRYCCTISNTPDAQVVTNRPT